MKNVLFCFLFLAGILGTSQTLAQGASRIEAMRLMQDGDHQLRSGLWEQAEISYSNAIQTDIGFAEAYMKRARLFQIMQRYSESLNDFNMAINLNPYSEYIYNQRSKLKMLAMDYKGAIDDINKAIQINPTNDKIRDFRVSEFISIGAYEQALVDIDTLIDRGYRVETEYEKKALVYLLIDDLDNCRLFVNEALRLNPKASIANDLLGLIELKDNRYEEAIKAFTLAIEENPEFGIAFYNRAIAYRLAGKSKLAIEDLNKAIEISHDLTNIYFARALVRKELGDMEGAIEDYNRVIMEDKSYAEALYNRAYTLKFMGDYNNALRDAETIVELEPQSPEHWNLKGNIHLLFGDYNEAIESYNEAIYQEMEYPEAYYNRGLAYLMSYRPIQGCEDLQRLINNKYEKAEKVFDSFCGKY